MVVAVTPATTELITVMVVLRLFNGHEVVNRNIDSYV